MKVKDLIDKLAKLDQGSTLKFVVHWDNGVSNSLKFDSIRKTSIDEVELVVGQMSSFFKFYQKI